MKVQIFIPCFIDQLYPSVGFSMVKVLEKTGCEVIYNANQTCCGQPAFNAGYWNEAKEVCKKFMNDFSGSDYIVAPSASCVGFVRNYYEKIISKNKNDEAVLNNIKARLFEFSEFMLKILKTDNLHAKFEAKATYHDSCAALRECRLKDEPRQLLKKCGRP